MFKYFLITVLALDYAINVQGADGSTEQPDDDQLCPSDYLKKYHNREFCGYLQDDIGMMLSDGEVCLLPHAEAKEVATADIKDCPEGGSTPSRCTRRKRRLCRNGNNVYSASTTMKKQCRVSNSEITSQINLQLTPECLSDSSNKEDETAEQCSKETMQQLVSGENHAGKLSVCRRRDGMVQAIQHDHSYCITTTINLDKDVKNCPTKVLLKVGEPPVDATYFHQCTSSIINNKYGKIVCGLSKNFLIIWNKIQDVICRLVGSRQFKFTDCPSDVFQTEFFRLLLGIEHISYDTGALLTCSSNWKVVIEWPYYKDYVCKYRDDFLLIDPGLRRFVCSIPSEFWPSRVLYQIKPCHKDYFTRPPFNFNDSSDDFPSSASMVIVKDSQADRPTEGRENIHKKRIMRADVSFVLESPDNGNKALWNLKFPMYQSHIRNWVNNSVKDVLEIKDLRFELETKPTQVSRKRSLNKHATFLLFRNVRQAVDRIVIQFTVLVLRDEADAADFPAQVAQILKKNVHKFDDGGEYQIDPNSIQVKQAVHISDWNVSNRSSTHAAVSVIGGLCLLGFIILIVFVKRTSLEPKGVGISQKRYSNRWSTRHHTSQYFQKVSILPRN